MLVLNAFCPPGGDTGRKQTHHSQVVCPFAVMLLPQQMPLRRLSEEL